jgi:hypothetical protein
VDAARCEAVVAVGLEAMEEAVMGRREAVALEVALEEVVPEAMRHIEAYAY